MNLVMLNVNDQLWAINKDAIVRVSPHDQGSMVVYNEGSEAKSIYVGMGFKELVEYIDKTATYSGLKGNSAMWG